MPPSLILDGDRHIAAVIAFRITCHGNPAAETEAEVAGRIEPRQRWQVARHLIHRDPAASQRVEVDLPRKLHLHGPPWNAVHDGSSDHCPRTQGREGTFGSFRAVGADDSGALAV